jgi:hypothetical protein
LRQIFKSELSEPLICCDSAKADESANYTAAGALKQSKTSRKADKFASDDLYIHFHVYILNGAAGILMFAEVDILLDLLAASPLGIPTSLFLISRHPFFTLAAERNLNLRHFAARVSLFFGESRFARKNRA